MNDVHDLSGVKTLLTSLKQVHRFVDLSDALAFAGPLARRLKGVATVTLKRAAGAVLVVVRYDRDALH